MRNENSFSRELRWAIGEQIFKLGLWLIHDDFTPDEQAAFLHFLGLRDERFERYVRERQ